MLSALIIDDEMYVRRKMRSIVDWESYGIALAGEAEHGRAALQFMASHPVDIIFTDLEMPGLSGIAFLQAVREAFPRVRIVVLTMHQEFEFIQQAMRLGVDDYIAKVQISEESFGPMLRDILLRIQNLPGQRRVHTDTADCLYYTTAQPQDTSREKRRLSERFFFRDPNQPIPGDAIAIRIKGLKGESYRELNDLLQQYVQHILFYRYIPAVNLYTCTAEDIRALAQAENGEPREALEAMLATSTWLMDNRQLMRALQMIPAMHMSQSTLTAFFYQPFMRCAAYLDIPVSRYFDITAGLLWWHQWQTWLLDLQGEVSTLMDADSTALRGIGRALLYIDAHFRENITLQSVLRIAMLSKSHFSHLFKQQTGMTFVDYVKTLRVEYAKVYLTDTAWPITQVAAQVGYGDEKYFRRVFLEIAGVSPAQYRKSFSSET